MSEPPVSPQGSGATGEIASHRQRAYALRPITVPILVSAITNLVAGYLWLFFTACFGVFLTAPMLVLCAFEILFFARAPQMSPNELDRRGTVLGLFEVILGVFNGISFVCGVIVLLNLVKMRDRNNQPTEQSS